MDAPGRISACGYGLATSVGAFLTLLAITCLLAHPGPAREDTGGQKPEQSEVSSHETSLTFQLRAERNLVVVRVVVRDSQGRVLSNLGKEDFTLFDDGKSQVISSFSVEQPSALPAAGAPPAKKEVTPASAAEAPAAPRVAQRFVALYFDDLHMAMQDVAQSRAAADRYIASALTSEDRVAIFTSSGVGELDFTDDRAKLHAALLDLQPRSRTLPTANSCPEIGEYQAYLMAVRNEVNATQIALSEAVNCICGMDPQGISAVANLSGGVSAAPGAIAPGTKPTTGSSASTCTDQAYRTADVEARRVWALGDQQSTDALAKLSHLVRRLAAMPGQRNLVLVSSGFLAATHQPEVEEVIDRALRSSVVINAVDAHGLYTYIPHEGNPIPGNMSLPFFPGVETRKLGIEQQGLTTVREVLSTLTAATGGTFFTNNNDLDAGFRNVGTLPEAYYVLTFTPSNLKMDGKFHTLKVRVNSSEPLTIQARRGYFAPRSFADPAAKEKEEIQEAVFSRDELHELPVEVNTRFFKINSGAARLSVLTRLDLRPVRFRKDKEQGRNLNTVKFVTVLFDRDGKYVNAKEKTIEFHLRDESLEKLAQLGITSRADFDLKPGTYMVREVVRDAEGGQISGLTRTVEIPY
jgi:VWFA-related protein